MIDDNAISEGINPGIDEVAYDCYTLLIIKWRRFNDFIARIELMGDLTF